MSRDLVSPNMSFIATPFNNTSHPLQSEDRRFHQHRFAIAHGLCCCSQAGRRSSALCLQWCMDAFFLLARECRSYPSCSLYGLRLDAIKQFAECVVMPVAKPCLFPHLNHLARFAIGLKLLICPVQSSLRERYQLPKFLICQPVVLTTDDLCLVCVIRETLPRPTTIGHNACDASGFWNKCLHLLFLTSGTTAAALKPIIDRVERGHDALDFNNAIGRLQVSNRFAPMS